jgi:hypothetical protein
MLVMSVLTVGYSCILARQHEHPIEWYVTHNEVPVPDAE